MTVRKTATRLADGRELFYFDDSQPYVTGTTTRRLDDPRPLPDRFEGMDNGPQMRRDPLTGEWVPMATHRMNRTFLPPADANPLAPARPGSSYQDGEIPDTDYDVVVFENRFPSLLAVPGVDATPGHVDGEELFEVAPAAGRCEVICFGPRLEDSLVDLGPMRMRTVIEAWADRTAELSRLDGIRQVFCFENHGEEIGVTLHHPHGQIYAYPYLPTRTQMLARRASAYRAETGRQLHGDILAAELRATTRILFEGEHWVAHVPVAAKWPIQAHLVPRRNVADIASLTKAERDELAPLYLRLLAAGNYAFHEEVGRVNLPYIASWNQAPVGEGREDLRLHLDYFSILRSPGKLKYLAGSESGMAAWISDTTPEAIADRLRAALPLADRELGKTAA
ncbi:MAG: galactose-1-phosphate uridylyltransferase [Bowdeniella nasicola]|nr:galactose-1-phosphate uridylyltransferase [Bowdeniella nasicola]